MKRKAQLIICLGAAFVGIFVSSAGAAITPLIPGRTVRVLAIGDSITRGSSGYQSWRGVLVEGAQRDGYRIGFTGPYADGPRPHWAWWGRRHAGVNGRVTGTIRKVLPEMLATYHPEIVLIASGSNDARLGTPMESVLESFRRIITDVQATGAWLLVSEVTPRWNRPNDPDPTYLTRLNTQLAAEVMRSGCRVIWVPAPGIHQHDTVDGVHLNAGGEVKLGFSWLEALTTPTTC